MAIRHGIRTRGLLIGALAAIGGSGAAGGAFAQSAASSPVQLSPLAQLQSGRGAAGNDRIVTTGIRAPVLPSVVRREFEWFIVYSPQWFDFGSDWIMGLTGWFFFRLVRTVGL